MKLFIGTLVTAILLVTTIGLCGCNNDTETEESAVPSTTPVATLAVTATAAESITVTRQRIRATAPGQMVSGAFLTLTNTSAAVHTLTSVSFDAAATVEIHETSMDGEMMRMRQVSHIDIPANGSVELKPGSYHVMLMELEKELSPGTTEKLILTFSDQSQKIVEAPVSHSVK